MKEIEMKFIGYMFGLSVIFMCLVKELVGLAYEAIRYSADVLYDGIRYRDWYL